MIIGTAGHIDHGKTALVKALTGVDTDRLPEEKRRGITIDLGFASLSLDGIGTVGVIDVPGHEDFVRSMVVGASGIDLGLLVVAADEGVMPQTVEHLSILQLLDIPQIAVAITKSDLVDAEWVGMVQQDVMRLFTQKQLREPTIVVCSARTGAGLDAVRTTLTRLLLNVARRRSGDVFRLPVDRCFTIKGTGTVVTGTVWSGELEADVPVVILPAKRQARVRRLEQHGKTTQYIEAGSRAAVALAGVDVEEAPRGSVVVRDERWVPTAMFEAVVRIDRASVDSLTPRTRLRLHAGATEVGAHITRGGVQRSSGDALARVVTDAPVVLRGGDRFVLRLPAPLRTIGGGVVVDPFARRRRLPGSWGDKLATLTTDPAMRLKYILESQATYGLQKGDIPIRVGCVPADVNEVTQRSGAFVARHNLFVNAVVEQVMATVTRIVAEFEIKSPLAVGVPARTVRESLRVNEELADVAISGLERAKEIESVGPLLRRVGWTPSPSVRDLEATDHLAHDICAAEHEPPSVGELVSRYGSSVPALLRMLERQGRIVQVERDRYYDRSALNSMVAQLKEALKPGKVYAPAQLRDVLGSSRKFLIPFLEFCDRRGITERRGEGRVLKDTGSLLLDTSSTHS
ncbi:MAG TPA: selenocysteine-specific translation elongation factor [Gemmatimonadaceae bacterium]|nr:selenocysteine-specific translation elongation factor [Gemmatimonadaceae bacterium]